MLEEQPVTGEQATATGETAPERAAEPAPEPAVTFDQEGIARIASAAAETTVRQGLEPAVEAYLQTLRNDLLEAAVARATETLDDRFQARAADLAPPLQVETSEEEENYKIKAAAEGAVRGALESQVAALERRQEQVIAERLAIMRIDLDEQKGAWLAEAHAAAVQAANEAIDTALTRAESSAYRVAREVAEASAKETAIKIANAARDQAVTNLSNMVERGVNQAKMFAAAAAGVALLAALAALLLS